MKLPKIFRKPVPSKDWLYVRDIVRKFLEDYNVKKLISPESEEYFLISEEKGVNILVTHGKITIANHKFLYKEDFSFELTESLIGEIRKQIEKERKQLKEELFKNSIDLLRKVYKYEK